MKHYISSIIFIIVLLLGACQNSSNSEKAGASSNNVTNSKTSHDDYFKKGKEIAMSTFGVLGGSLQKAMKEGGVENAVKYCNLSAFSIVDSLSQIHNAKIRRTSLKIRNQKDKATPEEEEQLLAYQKLFEAEERLTPVVKEIDPSTIAFYAPIHTTTLCLKCHGKLGSTLLKEDYEVIKKYYPKDVAIGYEDGDWRGMWSISFEK